ncbi:hypothetical protein [Herbidospora sp. RD11066]
MPRRSWISFALAFVVSAGFIAHGMLTTVGGSVVLGYVEPLEPCVGHDLDDVVSRALWSGPDGFGRDTGLLLAGFAGPIVVAVSVVVMAVTTMAGRPRLGRASVRVMVAALVASAHSVFFFAYDMVRGTGCLQVWGGRTGVEMFVLPKVPELVTAALILLAVRRSPVRWPVVRRVVAVALVATLVAADLQQGGITRPDCEGSRAETEAVSFLCAARRDPEFARISDRDLLAYGRAACALHPLKEPADLPIDPICPRARRDAAAIKAAGDAAWAAQEAVSTMYCDRTRHRPRVEARHVVRDQVWTEYGVIESWEGDHYDEELFDRSYETPIATSAGHLLLNTDPDYDTCLQVEVYAERPPEEKGWDRVAEVGYVSPEGHMKLADAMSTGDGLTVPGLRPGRYRVRLHYKEPDYDGTTPQVVVLMIWPEP